MQFVVIISRDKVELQYMCGICGFSGEDPDTIARMTAALRHRGPDGDAVSVRLGASLGHARLAILDPRPEGDQPMWNADQTIGIVYNGEIFNFAELREKYQLHCRTGTDTEVLLQLFEKKGMAFIPELKGMFAFGIYDSRDHSWHLARDPAGIKPLYITQQSGRLYFASEMRSLISGLPVKPEIDTISLSHYARLQYVPGPRTMCQGIESVQQGTVLSFKDGKLSRQTVTPAVEPEKYQSKADFYSQFPETMQSVVSDHLVSDKPVGVFLSGGMDSSILLHHMASIRTEPVETFTVRFDARQNEDAARFNTDADLAALTAKHYQTNHHEILFTAAECRELYADVACAIDTPNADSVGPAQYILSREAKKHVDVVLAGSGGDELFGGYPRYRIVRILSFLQHIPAPLRRAAAKALGYPPDILGAKPGWELALRLLARPATEVSGIAKNDWFAPTATDELFADWYSRLSSNTPVQQFMEFDRNVWLIDESLRLSDATTMGNGLECRVPFLDPRIRSLSQELPESWLVHFQQTKPLIKNAYRQILPEHLFTLGKAGFYPPFAKWLRRECAPLVEEMLAGPYIKEYFDIAAVRTMFDAHKNLSGYHLHQLSSLVQLHFWFTTVYDASE